MTTQKYAEINQSALISSPTPSPEEAIRGARLLLAEGFRVHEKSKLHRKWKFKITSGNRHTWRSRSQHGVFLVNPDYSHRRGWAGIVHSISHFVHERVNPDLRPHQNHEWTERHLTAYAIAKGFHLGNLKRAARAAKEPVDPAMAARASLEDRLKAWITKAKRADTAIRKITAQIKRLDKTGKAPAKKRKKPAKVLDLMASAKAAEAKAHRAVKEIARKLDADFKVDRSDSYFEMDPSAQFPHGFSTYHYDWTTTLDRLERCIADPSLMDEDGAGYTE